MTHRSLTSFKAYDIRGCIGAAQHLRAASLAVGHDARATSAGYAAAVALGACDAGADVTWIGLAGTEEMYWAVTEFGACGGIEVTASHNPVDLPALRPLTVVVNSGNGAAGPTFDAIAAGLAAAGAPLDFVRVHHAPDPTFPNGIPNPLLPENHAATAEAVLAERADFGVAFDGDFDRCFLFDGHGQFVPGEYVVGLLAEAFLAKEPGGVVVHDPRVVWNTRDVVARAGGRWQTCSHAGAPPSRARARRTSASRTRARRLRPCGPPTGAARTSTSWTGSASRAARGA